MFLFFVLMSYLDPGEVVVIRFLDLISGTVMLILYCTCV